MELNGSGRELNGPEKEAERLNFAVNMTAKQSTGHARTRAKPCGHCAVKCTPPNQLDQPHPPPTTYNHYNRTPRITSHANNQASPSPAHPPCHLGLWWQLVHAHTWCVLQAAQVLQDLSPQSLNIL